MIGSSSCCAIVVLPHSAWKTQVRLKLVCLTLATTISAQVVGDAPLDTNVAELSNLVV
jgi:hypothetical protein